MGSKRTKNAFAAFEYHLTSELKPLPDVIQECLEIIQDDIPKINKSDHVVPAIVISALASVGAWPKNLSRDQILETGSASWSENNATPLSVWWREDVYRKKPVSFLPEIVKHKFSPIISGKSYSVNEKLDLKKPRDGPSEIWSTDSLHKQTGRRAVLSYVHDKSKATEEQLAWNGDRRAVRLTLKEVKNVEKPVFFSNHHSKGLDDVWHDGMKYPSPDGKWNSYAGVVPYLLSGSAVWHLVPRIREDDALGYPSTKIGNCDKIIARFAQLRSGELKLNGFDDVTVLHATDKPFRDLSGVLRLWPMAEATCGMLRDDLIISIQDMAGVALTLMHYDKLLEELVYLIKNYDDSSKVKRKGRLLCIPRRDVVDWTALCSCGEGATAIVKQIMTDINYVGNGWDALLISVASFFGLVQHLKFWYALLMARGPIENLQNLRFEVLEDLAIAPAWEEEDRAKVYFMLEAALINRLERHIPYEESIRRFLRAGMGGKLLLDSVNLRTERIEMEMTRAQHARMLSHNQETAWRQPGWQQDDRALRASWLSGAPGLCYLGRFTTSMSKPLYIEAALRWGGQTNADLVQVATESKKRMVILLTFQHRLYRKVDVQSNTVINVFSMFYLDEEEFNLARSRFGNTSFHGEMREFRGRENRWDASGHAVAWAESKKLLCVVDHNGNYFEIRHPVRTYQVVVTHAVGAEHAHLAAIRLATAAKGQREPVAVSYMDVLQHIKSDEGNSLLQLRPDRISPDGVSIVDYSFEYDACWAECDGRKRVTAVLQGETEEEVHQMIRFFRDANWLG